MLPAVKSSLNVNRATLNSGSTVLKNVLSEERYNQYKSVYKAAGLGENGPSGIYEGEYTTNTYACSYDEYPVDPEILAQAELNEARSDNTYRASLSKSNSLRLNRDGKSWGRPVSVKNLNRFT